MADSGVFLSSQRTQHEQENPLDLGHFASSPLAPSSSINSRKPRKPPPITPKRFTKFFTPRTSSTGGRKSATGGKSARQLRDITRNAINRRRPTDGKLSSNAPLFADINVLQDENIYTPRLGPGRKRKGLPSPESSPIQPSPSKRTQPTSPPLLQVVEAEEEDSRLDDELLASSPPVEHEEEYEEELELVCLPIRRLRHAGVNARILQRSFGEDQRVGRGRYYDHCTTNPMVAIGDEEGGIRLLDSDKGNVSTFSKAYVSLRPHTNAVMDLAFSSDDLLLATASGDQTARIIDVRAQSTRFVMAGHASSVKQVRFQPGNDSVIATSSRDGSVRLWDTRCRGSEGPVLNIRTSLDPDGPDPLTMTPHISRYVDTYNSIPDAHAYRQSLQTLQKTANVMTAQRDALLKGESPGRRGDVSITALAFLGAGRDNLLLTASEASACVKLWDIRGKYTPRRGPAVPISTTREPDSHHQHRHFGINSLALSGDGGRLYALCRDSTVYAYSTNHLVLGHAPELSSSTPALRHGYRHEGKEGLGPLYGFRHSSFHAATFYVKSSLRPAQDDRTELLAVGSSDGCVILFPTEERLLRCHAASSPHSDHELPSDHYLTPPARPRRARSPLRRSPSGLALSASGRLNDTIPIYEQGTALIRGHQKEVTSLTWTSEGELVTVGDDFTARCWREGGEARELRRGGEAGGRRWACGWAETGEEDEEEDE
ncbi:hypothetical protein LTR04_000552 [Oleoguttula sp. CCFEE 6159]|nr:hypothetical protein LTR04_000552 [Oleoguttula sp. CCFEE 6159]